MSDLPQQVMVWHGYTDLEHIGMWSTTRYPEDAVAYVPLARLEAVEKERDDYVRISATWCSMMDGKLLEQKARAERAEAALTEIIMEATSRNHAIDIARRARHPSTCRGALANEAET